MLLIELVASLFGALSVYLYIVRNHWAWPIGLVQVVLFVAVFASSKLYADMILHVVYAVLQLYGWWTWSQSRFSVDVSCDPRQAAPQQPALEIRRLRPLENLAAIGVVIAMTVLFASLLSRFTDASLPLPDSFIAAASLVAQMLLAWRYYESWLYWIAVDAVAIALFGYKGLAFTTGLYCVFLVMAIIGYRSWVAQLEVTRRRELTPVQ